MKKINLNLRSETDSQLECNVILGRLSAFVFFALTVVLAVYLFRHMTFDGFLMIVIAWAFYESLNMFLSAMILVRLSRKEKTKRGYQ